ncbi:NADH-cytochrome b5 reductase 2 [Hypsizygus marmoreus]|uniref:NADH-cytochrome b5 reductase n=1 Tax=Hypsizygus marmoreus TaxID=39966 RepID=A0A369K7V2_HYPMA|nr:NADH-cytochrome b5 reductase 2 [Hypsizygus marmoreus]
MSFLRVAASRSLAAGTRRYASTTAAAPKKPSNTPYVFLAASKQEKSSFNPENFTDFKLKKVIPYNHNTSKFVFELPNNEASLLPISSLVLIKSSDPEALKDAEGKPIIRPYTPISPPDERGQFTLLIKKYETGNASKYIHGLKAGDSLSFKGPIVKFPYKQNEFDEIALIGGGTGITPLYQVLTHALADKSNKTKFKLLFSNITEKDILLREEIDELQKKFPKTLDVVYLVDKPESTWTGPTGFISADVIKQHVAPPSLNEKVKIFVCGPPGQVAAVAGKKAGMKQGELSGILKELGYTEDQVFKF